MRVPLHTHGYMLVVTSKRLEGLLALPDKAEILKIVPSEHADNSFNVLVYDPEGYEIPEGGTFPIKEEI